MWELKCAFHPCIFSVFNQGEEGTSWYIIQKGSVNVVIYGKVCISAASVGRGGIICNKQVKMWRRLVLSTLEAPVMSKPDLLTMTPKCD